VLPLDTALRESTVHCFLSRGLLTSNRCGPLRAQIRAPFKDGVTLGAKLLVFAHVICQRPFVASKSMVNVSVSARVMLEP